VLLDQDTPLRVVVDDTLMRRSGRKVFGASWHHDPLAAGRRRVAWGNNWVVLGVLVALPFVPQRTLCLNRPGFGRDSGGWFQAAVVASG
jgi:hypothetical protein